MRNVETDYEWYMFIQELNETEFAKINELKAFLSIFEIGGKIDLSQVSNEKIMELQRLALERTKIPSFLNGLPEKDWDIENVFERIKEEFFKEGIILKNENIENRKFYIVFKKVDTLQFQITKATVTKMLLNPNYGENYRKDILVLQCFFENLAQKDNVLALEILKMIEKRIPFIIINSVLKVNKSESTDYIAIAIKTIKKVFINILSELQIEPEQLKEMINSIGESSKKYSSRNWFKTVYFRDSNLAKLIQEIYDFLYKYGELDDIKQTFSAT